MSTDKDFETVSTWMLQFRGEEGVTPNQPILESVGYSANYFPQELGHTGKMPEPDKLIPVVLQITHKLREPNELTTRGDGIYSFDPPFVKLDFTGFETSETLTIKPQGFGPVSVVKDDTSVVLSKPPTGSTENILIRATLRTRTDISDQKVFGVECNDQTYGRRITFNDMYRKEVDLTTQPLLDISIKDFQYVQPIFYLEQTTGSFVLLAEVSCRKDSATQQVNNERRILFAIQQSIEDFEGDNSVASISNRQLVFLTPPYEVANGLEYTIRVQQDGDLLFGRDPQPYLEFWVESIPLGIYKLKSESFPFKVYEKTRICIGYWPREEMGKKLDPILEWKDLCFQGELGEVIFDPHGVCPCAT